MKKKKASAGLLVGLPSQYIGVTIWKQFLPEGAVAPAKLEWFRGKVTRAKKNEFHVLYENGDEEDIGFEELQTCMQNNKEASIADTDEAYENIDASEVQSRKRKPNQYLNDFITCY